VEVGEQLLFQEPGAGGSKAAVHPGAAGHLPKPLDQTMALVTAPPGAIWAPNQVLLVLPGVLPGVCQGGLAQVVGGPLLKTAALLPGSACIAPCLQQQQQLIAAAAALASKP
jgi:hypothetical protein